QPSGQTSGPVDQTPQQKAEDMTAPENFTSLSNIPLIAERRPDMTMPTRDISAHLATDKWSLAIVFYSAVYLALGSLGTIFGNLHIYKYLI
ncbi:hypothetical protein, partial [Parasphingorhabdus sp.]|uniref:hypothetical protein n=1 Tax=Parasphingorhabdus sp. TaxID=2709688 RepID=UPI0032EC8DC6